MCRHEEKYCPRCNCLFECKAGNISQCQCYGIKQSEATIKYIREAFDDCLCASCMKELEEQYLPG